MPNLADRYIDLVASGDEAKIKCVTSAGFAGAATGGIVAAKVLAPSNLAPGGGQAAYAIGVGVSAVVGLLIGINAGMKVCGGGTEGSFGRLFSGHVTDAEMSVWKDRLKQKGLSDSHADALVSASIIELQANGMRNIDRAARFDISALTALAERIGGAVRA